MSEGEAVKFMNLCSVPEVTMAKPLHVRLKMEKDWSFYMTGWKLLKRLKLPRPHQETGTSFCVPEEIRQMASDAAKSRDPVRRRHIRKISRKARR